MDNEKKLKILLIASITAGVLAVVCIIICLFIYTESNKEQKIQQIKEEYTAALEQSMKDVYDDRDCVKYQLSDISYSITNVENTSDNCYTVSVVVDCKSSYPGLDSTEKSLLAYGVEDYVPGGYDDEIESSTGETITLVNENYKDSYYDEEMLTVNVNGERIHGPEERTHSSSSKSDTVTCKSCGRSFQKDSENAKSIKWTNMCTNCYNNYKYASSALKEAPIN